MGRKKKNPYADLSETFCDAIASASTEEIRSRIGEIAIIQQELMEAKEMDEDFQRKKEAFSIAGEVYRHGTKENRLKIEFARSVLKDRGVPLATLFGNDDEPEEMHFNDSL